eukprot:c4358_g1_i1.p1 GENE.c4358_g1_i1~~c4358_g1_i1.p1  ORF type:complete len:847 (-),score=201.77 c4358_g1_i1:157-2418(-)
MTTVIIVIKRTDGQSVLVDETQNFVNNVEIQIKALSNTTKAPYRSMIHYWYATKANLTTLSESFVSHDNKVTIVDVNVDNSNTDKATDFLKSLLDIVHNLRGPLTNYEIQVTGNIVFFKDIREGADKDLARVDGISLPIALIVLAYVLRSMRLVLMPLLSIGVSVLTSFTIMYPISFAIDVTSVTPSLMMSTTIALSIDYSLFLFSRFTEELRAGRDATQAMETSLRMAGETILVSGTTLCICFLGLTMLPLSLLQSMGLGAGCAVICAMSNSLNLVPALVFAFPKFFGNAQANDLKFIYDKCCGFCRRTRSEDAFRLAPMPSHSPVVSAREELDKSKWFKWTNTTIKWRYPVFLVLLISMIPFLWQALLMKTSSQLTLTVPRNVESVTAYNTIGEFFGDGTLMPYDLLLVSRPGSFNALQPQFFNAAHELVACLVSVHNSNLGRFTGLPVFNGSYVTFEQWYNAVENHAPDELSRTLLYFTGSGSFVNAVPPHNATAQKISIVLEIDPSSPDGGTWLKDTRDAIKSKDWGVDVYLASGASTEIDGINMVYEFLPVQMAVTAGVVFLLMLAAFRSVVVPLRSIFSIALTLSWTYGISKLVYNDGILGWLKLKPLAQYDGVSWFTPVMCFSILTGFGLDYDIFLLTRIAEFRSMGFTDHSSISLAVHKTGGIITAAGCIMAIAFGGLLVSTMPLLNMCSFFIVFSVLFDTFVVRTIMVPALMAIIGRANFWPRTLPPPYKEAYDMPTDMADAST